ncbi:hypothetical protein [Halovivax gelatinilyticus]|uniref:hypothetical protein n=1 Tax=Halovivax gelatinilyticus TaxID=2961597 RepID=UPI0020CA5903|nr:hypothetical protein [Halovivax gelatinilyticus]
MASRDDRSVRTDGGARPSGVGADSLVHVDESADWEARVDELLYAGETVRERVRSDDHELVVTSHRVLLFRPDSTDGPRFRQVDRPNVAEVRLQTVESLRLLAWSVVFAAVGFGLVVAAFSYEFGGVIPDLNGGGPATGAVSGTVEALESILAMFELFVLVTGLLTICLALGSFGWYLRTRSQRLVVAVVGEADLSIPRPADAESVAAALERAIDGTPVAESGSLVGIRSHADGGRSGDERPTADGVDSPKPPEPDGSESDDD